MILRKIKQLNNLNIKQMNELKMKAKKLILALGESTNTHVMTCEKEVLYDQKGSDIDFLLKETGVVTHEEHDKQILPPGQFSKTNQVEFSPFDESIHAVFD